MKRVLSFLLPWVDSNSQLWPGPPFQVLHQQKEKTENFSVSHGSAYRDCPYFIFTPDPGEFSLGPSCGCHSLIPPFWRQLCNTPDFHISPGWVCHLSSPIWPSPDVSLPLVFCVPGRLEFCCIHSYGRSLSVQGRGAHQSLNHDMWWQSLHVYI